MRKTTIKTDYQRAFRDFVEAGRPKEEEKIVVMTKKRRKQVQAACRAKAAQDVKQEEIDLQLDKVLDMQFAGKC